MQFQITTYLKNRNKQMQFPATGINLRRSTLELEYQEKVQNGIILVHLFPLKFKFNVVNLISSCWVYHKKTTQTILYKHMLASKQD